MLHTKCISCLQISFYTYKHPKIHTNKLQNQILRTRRPFETVFSPYIRMWGTTRFFWICRNINRGDQDGDSSYFGPAGDDQHQTGDGFLQHHDEQVDSALTEPRRSLGGFTWSERGGAEEDQVLIRKTIKLMSHYSKPIPDQPTRFRLKTSRLTFGL